MTSVSKIQSAWQAAVDIQQRCVYLPGPHLLDQFPVASQAVCVHMCEVGKFQQAEGCGVKIPELKQDIPQCAAYHQRPLILLCRLDVTA